MMDILMSETCWVHKKWNKIASDIKLVFHSSTVTMMHGPINVRCSVKCPYSFQLFIVTAYTQTLQWRSWQTGTIFLMNTAGRWFWVCLLVHTKAQDMYVRISRALNISDDGRNNAAESLYCRLLWSHKTLCDGSDKELHNLYRVIFRIWPASWSSGQGLWLLIMRSRVRFPVLPWEFFLAGKDSRGDHGLGS